MPLGGDTGGSDRVASGVIRDSSSGGTGPKPTFSPAISVQTRTGPGVVVRFRAGTGDGPWWLPIQRGFGPIYLEQIGLGVTYAGDDLDTVSLLLDGRLSIAGLVVAVDDLAITAHIRDDLGKASSWEVSMAGLAVSSDMGGVQISGGLRHTPGTSDYMGMLTVRWGPYGLTVFGGYSVVEEPVTPGAKPEEYTSLFLYGAQIGRAHV